MIHPANRAHAAPALLALVAGCLVYAWARPRSLFAIAAPDQFVAWTAALPSLLHTFAFALLCAAFAATPRGALLLATGWGLLETVAEFAQHESVGLLAGTFDWLDLAAIATGTLAAAGLVLIQRRSSPC